MAWFHVAILACVMALAQTAPRPVVLADRLPLPDGYGSEQDTESDGVRDFSTAAGVRGHILRRFVQAGDDKASVADLAAFFAGAIRDQGGSVFDDRVNNMLGRLDGRVPGAQPLWIHIDIGDEGGVVDVTLLEERAPVKRDMPVEQYKIPGSWSVAAAPGLTDADASTIQERDRISAKLAPIFKPYSGWDWRLVAEPEKKIRLFARARTQACATCAVIVDSKEATVAIFDTRAGLKIDIPSRRQAGEVSLLQLDLVARIFAAKLEK